MNTSEQLVSLIRELIREEMSKKDASSICQIASVNENGTVNIILPSDPDTIIPNIKNTSGYEFVSGDYGVLYKIENKLNNSFIFSKIFNQFKLFTIFTNFHKFSTFFNFNHKINPLFII